MAQEPVAFAAMRSLLVSALVLLSGCFTSQAEPDASVSADAGDAGVAADGGAGDAGTSDAGTTVTWDTHIGALLFAKCSDCHRSDGGLPQFAAHYDALLRPSRLCAGERVGDCVKYALEAQATEGSGCRTYVVRPFHREGWVCLTQPEIDQVVGWIDAGMLER